LITLLVFPPGVVVVVTCWARVDVAAANPRITAAQINRCR
jgi:hypothetical protein